ncbi:MAG: hypothetical protein LC790_21520 [Actinobacteria bacterium]|nr:hypothetical protein [Actinomycetota bacterium]
MGRITEVGMTHATGLVCDECGHRETDALGGLGAIMARGWWVQAMTVRHRHLCGRCYRGLEPMAREGYWHRQSLLELTDRQP